MKCQLVGATTAAVVVAMPAARLHLRELISEYGEMEVQRIIASTGIESVCIAPPEMTTSDLCEQAAQQLFRETSTRPSDVDGIVFVSQTPDYIMPATSAVLQHRLGMPTASPAFDLNSGCSGYIYGLFQAWMLISSGACSQVLVCAGDTLTRFVHPGDRSVRMVFGDAASATLVTKGSGVASFALYSDGSGGEHLRIPAGGCRIPRTALTGVARADSDGNTRSLENLFMDGAEVMSFALQRVPRVLDETLALAGWSKESVGLYGLHQANKFMVDYLAKASRLPKGSAPVAVRHTGNTGPASIPLMMTLLRDELPPVRRERTILCGFGVGLSWGACALDLSSTVLLPPVEV